MHSFLSAAGLALSMVVVSALSARAQFDSLAGNVPATANAIALVDVQRLFNSPLALKENWKEKYDNAFASGVCSIPPFAERMVLAAEVEYEYMRPRWELALIDLAESRTAAMIARASKGVIDPIGTLPAVAIRDNCYVIEFGPKRLGAMAPANRQAVARWLRETRGRAAPALSSYLRGSLVASEKSPVVMAFDLEDAVPPEVIRAKLSASEAVAAKKVDVDAATKALASIRGVALEIFVDEEASGRIRVHFSGDAKPLAPVAMPLLAEILDGIGAHLGDLENWQTMTESQRFTFEGPLTTSGMRRLFSLIDSQTADMIAIDSDQPASVDQPSARAYASQQFFKSLTSILEEVRTEAKKAKTFGQNAMWFDKWARRIDKLPIQNVDKELLDFGRAVAAALRSMATDMRGIGIHSATHKANIGVYSYYAEWMYADAQQRAAHAQERSKGVLSARDNYQALENEAARMRQLLTDRYQVAF